MSKVGVPVGSALRLSLVCLLATLAPFIAAHAEGPSNTSEYASIRATGPQLPEAMVDFVAEALPSIRLDRAHYPQVQAFTPEQIVKVLCGSVRKDYMQLLMTRLHLEAAGLNKPIGPRVYDIDWPACLFVQTKPPDFTYTVRKGDTLSALRLEFTGVPGTATSNASFFGIPTDKAASGQLSLGETLRVPYTTAALAVHTPSAPETIPKLRALAAQTASSGFANDIVQIGTPTRAGRIVTFMQGNDSKPVDPAECAGVRRRQRFFWCQTQYDEWHSAWKALSDGVL
jgi:hypothetical protein